MLFPGTPERPSSHCSAIWEVAPGRLVAVWYAGTWEGEPDVAVMMAEYDQGSDTWSNHRVLVDTPGLPEGNPIIFTSRAGRMWLFYCTIVRTERGWDGTEFKARYSDDGGKTWSEDIVFGEPLGTIPRNKPVFIGDRILVPLYHDPSCSSFIYISEDDTATWRRGGCIRTRQIGGGCIQPAIIQQNSGRLVAFMRDCGGKHVWKSYSDDLGETWQPAVPTDLPNPDAATDVVKLASGTVLIAFNDTTERRTPLSVGISDDDGETWPLKVDIETAEGEYSYPAIIQASDGLIHLTYTYKREGIKHVTFDEEWLRANAKPRA